MMNIWALLGLDTPAPGCPFQKTAEKTDRKKREERPDNLVHYAGRAFVQSEDVENGVFEDTLYKGQGQRTGDVSAKDLDIIRALRLDETKYRELKPLWASGLSAAKAARTFSGRYGYGVRTLDDYWKAFSQVSSAPSTPPAERGEGRKTPASARKVEFSY